MQDSEEQAMAQAAWLYYVGGFNQEETARRLGTTRARVNKMLADARESGLVSISINSTNVGLLPQEEAIRAHFGLEFCISTPRLRSVADEDGPLFDRMAFRAVGTAAAAHLRQELQANPNAVVGTGWGRTIEQMTLQLAGVNAPKARFISLMGSLTANSAYNPFEVVHALARKTDGQGFFLPVPFIADTPQDHDVLVSQRSVQDALAIARSANLAYVSIGELSEASLLRAQDMITPEELAQLQALGAVGDTNGFFYDINGRAVDHSLSRRTIALGFDELASAKVVGLVAGRQKMAAAIGLLRSGICKGLILDGDTAVALCEHLSLKA
jgi:DNA-binding transcriptional regulator LsrR (DeoR family)